MSYDLKLALEARGLSTEGLKKVLKARLLEPEGVARVHAGSLLFAHRSFPLRESRSSRPELVPRVFRTVSLARVMRHASRQASGL